MKNAKVWGRALVCVSCAAMAVGCGGGGGGSGGGGDVDEGPDAQVAAYNFTSENMVDAASQAVSNSDLYPIMTELLVGVATELGSGDGTGRVAAAQIPVGDLGICLSGTATLVWNDADDDGELSAGDLASITFDDCVLDEPPVNGVVNVEFTTVLLPELLEATLTVQVTVQETLDGDPVTSGLSVKCGVSVTTSDQAEDTIVYSFEAADEILTATVDGVVVHQFSCGQVTLKLSLSNPTTFLLAPVGVVHDPSVGLLTIVAPAGGGLFFAEGEGGDFYPDSGTWRLLSLGECATFGAPNGVGDSTMNTIQLTALAGDGDDMQAIFTTRSSTFSTPGSSSSASSTDACRPADGSQGRGTGPGRRRPPSRSPSGRKGLRKHLIKRLSRTSGT